MSLARQIAEALEEAHEKGIIHRDLKPQNIKASIEGKVKVLDFGLAKAMDPGSDSASAGDLARSPTLLNSPTLTAVQGTQLGVILGTAAYMAPEQARGGRVDKRADIWAFGVVLYEVLTGRSLFSAETVSDTLAGVLRAEIDLDALPASTPPAIRRLLGRCLERNPKNRLRDIGEARVAIEAARTGDTDFDSGLEAVAGPGAAAASGLERHAKLAWTLAALAVAAALGLGYGFVVRAPGTPRVLRSSIELPPGLTVDGDNDSLALSPDGKTLAIAATDRRTQQIYLRALDGPALRALDGTKGATSPTWSPDGRWLAFFADGKLEKIEVASGAVQTLAEAPQGRGITWGPDGSIVYAPDLSGPLWKVSSGGGNAAALEKDVPEGWSHRDPRFLPGGKSLFYLSITGGSTAPAQVGDGGLHVLDLASGESRRLLPDLTEGRFVAPGYLAFVRDGNLMVQRFDPKARSSRGRRSRWRRKFDSTSFGVPPNSPSRGTSSSSTWSPRPAPPRSSPGSTRTARRSEPSASRWISIRTLSSARSGSPGTATTPSSGSARLRRHGCG